ncbi:ABC transporter permease [Luteolibacter yonseiensis]|uniref:ABC transporter permease n=1 Tax=Luteolibacter yonseiensis TaxID=1144680 RepID=A0A934VC60_9BACT|nr:ABC transporter permease [Luteolibacter yonseiensis]MBK1817988.1 ABC transporter permease [Luteolibacter yonseiensis]
MTFFTIIVRGLLRRPVRTGLTLVGISIGIAAVVALVGISRGFEQSWAKGMQARGTDIVVSSMGSGLAPKPFNTSVRDRISAVPGVAAACSLYVDLTSIESSSMMIVSSREWGGFSWQNLKLISGRLPNDAKEPAVVLGPNAAEVLGKKVGDPLQIDTRELTVVGIVDGGALVENGSVILSLSLYQEITGNEGQINVVDVRVEPGRDEAGIKKICAEINTVVTEAKALPAGENIGNSQAYKFISAMSWGTSLLAVIVGVLGVMNTMLMTVFERKQEISILLAIGWRRSRVMRMILLESALLGFLGGVTGVIVGSITVKVLEKMPAINGLLEPDLSVRLMVISVAISVIVGVISGLYPAWRSSRLKPSLAMQG